MLRNLAVLMSALVVMSAQAKDGSTREGKRKPAPSARSAEGKRREPALVGREPVQRRQPLSPSAKPAQPDAGTNATTPAEPNDCGIEQSFFDEHPTPVAIRFYKRPAPAASTEQDNQPRSWKSPPEVLKAGRCGPKYVIQIKSESNEPYAVKEAKPVGVDGEVLKVIHILSRVSADNKSINIITMERTKNISEPDYKVTLLLIGEDGRGFVFQGVKLP